MIDANILLYVKYAIAIAILLVIILAPAWIARQTKRDKTEMAIIRISSWLFGWTGVGWLVALYLAARK